jgi:hypothetical protein
VTLGQLLVGGLLVAFAAIALLALQRILRTMRRGRDLARFQHGAADLARRLAATAEPAILDVDDLRRRSADPLAAGKRIAGAIPALRALATEARSVRVPAGLEPLATALAGELSRAQRSAELAQTGVEALADPRSLRDGEASIAFKRAALNLRNAVDEAGRLATRIGAVRVADLDRPGAIPGAVATASLPTYGTDDDDLPIGS